MFKKHPAGTLIVVPFQLHENEPTGREAKPPRAFDPPSAAASYGADAAVRARSNSRTSDKPAEALAGAVVAAPISTAPPRTAADLVIILVTISSSPSAPC